MRRSTNGLPVPCAPQASAGITGRFRRRSSIGRAGMPTTVLPGGDVAGDDAAGPGLGARDRW